MVEDEGKNLIEKIEKPRHEDTLNRWSLLAGKQIEWC